MQKKVWYYEKWVGSHASFPSRRSVKLKNAKLQKDFFYIFTYLLVPLFLCENKALYIQAAELVDMTSGANVVEVGTWEPMQGLVLGDDLFPHVTGGLRGRVLTVASMDVSNKCIHLQYIQVFRLMVIL